MAGGGPCVSWPLPKADAAKLNGAVKGEALGTVTSAAQTRAGNAHI